MPPIAPKAPLQSIIHRDTLTKAMRDTIAWQLDIPIPDAVLNIETAMFNLLVSADRCEYEVDIGKDVWLNVGRWSRLIREYISRTHLERFVSQAQEILRGDSRTGATANMFFKDPDRFAKKHRWGGCLMGMTFRGKYTEKPTITVFSRTTYIGYMGLLDAAIIAVMAKHIWPEHPGEIAARWHITSSQLHCFKTLPYIFSQPELLDRLNTYTQQLIDDPVGAKANLSPSWYHICKWYLKILQAFEEHGTDMLLHEKYGPFKRIKRRWMESQGHLNKHIPPSLTVDMLSFDKSEHGDVADMSDGDDEDEE